MYFFFSGTDTDTLREELSAAVEKAAQGASVLRITDAHSRADLDAALLGGGMFAQKRVVIFDNVLTNMELRDMLLAALPSLTESSEQFFIVESAPDAATRKQLEKLGEKSERFDAKKGKQQETIFSLANALQRGDKKALWVGYQRELQAGKAPEAIHGVLFWAAKQALLRSANESNRARVAALTELPHEARRRGEELEYALERFVLAVA